MFNVRVELIVRDDDGGVVRDDQGVAQTEVVHHTGVDVLATEGPRVRVMHEDGDRVVRARAVYAMDRIVRLEVTD